MRTILLCLLVASLMLSATAAPIVEARISREDVNEICQVINRVTHEPVRSIHWVASRRYVPGAIRSDADITTETGRKRVRSYERTDRVSVLTGVKSGKAYDVQKINGSWKIVATGSWIE